ncbi:MAG: PQQ-like beta-propeller repeat protein [Phycisphaerales bacterium]|nr:MAG: PQQ-like beta-propeller repeat protein [Phycisphaerales bacterium]
MLRRRVFVWITIAILGVCVQVFAADWPQWRGPNRDGVWSETGVLRKFGAEQLPVLWRAKIANGYSAPTVANGRAYVTDRLASPTQMERVHSFDAETGEGIWSHRYECRYEGVSHRNGPRAAVTVDGNRAYSLGTMGHLFCLDAAKGNVLWSKDLRKQYRIRVPEWGIAASPLVEKGLLIVLIGGENACVVAFEKVTGQEQWRALSDRVGYSAPIVIDQAGKRVLVCWTGERIVGLDASTGRLYWEHPFAPAQMIHNIATPVFAGGHLFFSGFFDGSLLLKVRPDRLAVEQVWRRMGRNEKDTDSLHCCISTAILKGDHIYGVDSYGELRCLDLYTGDRIWESLAAVPKARWATLHMVEHGKETWMFTERGELIISTLSPRGYDEISRAKLIRPTEGQLDQRGGVCWAHPAFANKRVYVRNDEELLCADLSQGD